MHAISRLSLPLAPLVLAASPAPTQIPPDHLVVASFVGLSIGYPGPGGVAIVHPSGTPSAPMAALPQLCTGAGLSMAGNQCVVHLATSGRIVASGGNFATAPNPLEVYVITPSGNLGATVASVVTHSLGTFTNTNGVGICAMAELGDGRVLIALDPTSVGGPFAGRPLVILDPSLPPGPGALTAVPITGMPSGFVNAMAVDVEAQIAYLSFGNMLWRVPVPGGGSPQLLASLPQIHALAVENDGRVLAGGPLAGFSASWLRRIDPSTYVVTDFPNMNLAGGAVNALHVDAVTGDLYFAFVTLTVGNQVQRLSPRTTSGLTSVVASLPGCISGIDQHARLETYGAASGSGTIARWQLAPNPGGSPAPGNAGFSLTCSAATGATYLWAIGLQRTNVQVTASPPVTLHVQPVAVQLTQSNTMPLPIPADPALAGLQLFAQCAQLLPGGAVRATSGLQCNL